MKRLNPRSLSLLAAMALAVAAATAAAIHKEDSSTSGAIAPLGRDNAGRLSVELERCRTIAANDTSMLEICRQIWANHRRQFFAPTISDSSPRAAAPPPKYQDRIVPTGVTPGVSEVH